MVNLYETIFLPKEEGGEEEEPAAAAQDGLGGPAADGPAEEPAVRPQHSEEASALHDRSEGLPAQQHSEELPVKPRMDERPVARHSEEPPVSQQPGAGGSRPGAEAPAAGRSGDRADAATVRLLTAAAAGNLLQGLTTPAAAAERPSGEAVPAGRRESFAYERPSGEAAPAGRRESFAYERPSGEAAPAGRRESRAGERPSGETAPSERRESHGGTAELRRRSSVGAGAPTAMAGRPPAGTTADRHAAVPEETRAPAAGPAAAAPVGAPRQAPTAGEAEAAVRRRGPTAARDAATAEVAVAAAQPPWFPLFLIYALLQLLGVIGSAKGSSWAADARW